MKRCKYLMLRCSPPFFFIYAPTSIRNAQKSEVNAKICINTLKNYSNIINVLARICNRLIIIAFLCHQNIHHNINI